jgi:hypothetical protein
LQSSHTCYRPEASFIFISRRHSRSAARDGSTTADQATAQRCLSVARDRGRQAEPMTQSSVIGLYPETANGCLVLLCRNLAVKPKARYAGTLI